MSSHPHEGHGTVPQAPSTDDAGPEAPRTGDPRVDEALGGVADLDEHPVDEHAERLAAAHGALQEVLRSPSAP
jgi:hypothetical protein